MTACRGCKIEFTSKRIGQKYHNRACFLKSSLKLISCPECGNNFQKRFTKQICCSAKCANNYRAKKQIRGTHLFCTLASCNKPIFRMPSRIKKYNFCCQEHRVDYQKSEENKDFGKGWKHTSEEIELIRQASLNRDYDKVLTPSSRQKMAEAARNKTWSEASKEKLRQSRLGQITPESVKQKIKLHAPRGWKNDNWKGRYSSYPAKHIWADKYMAGPRICVNCGATEKERKIEASNKDHKYYKRLEDWAWRCVPCHRKYDLEHGLVNPKGKARSFFGIKSVQNI